MERNGMGKDCQLPVAVVVVVEWAVSLTFFLFCCSLQITRHMSPHEIHPVGPWLKTWPKKVVDRAPTYIMYPGGCALLTYMIVSTTAGIAHAEERAHRY